MEIKILGAAVAFALVADPALAGQLYGQSIFCASGPPGRNQPHAAACVEGCRKLTLPEEDRRLVVIVPNLWIAGGREWNDGELAQGQSFRHSKSDSRRFAGDRRVGLQASSFPGIECLHVVGCFSGLECSFGLSTGK